MLVRRSARTPPNSPTDCLVHGVGLHCKCARGGPEGGSAFVRGFGGEGVGMITIEAADLDTRHLHTHQCSPHLV